MATSIIGASEERAAAASIKENFPSTRIGFFGAFASVDVDEFLRVGDFVIQGEPEQLCQEIAGGLELPEGLVVSEKIKDLDNLPNPDYRGFSVSDYTYAPLLKNRPFLPITTTRGCPYDCFYCPYMVNQGKYFRKHSIQRVIEQIEECIRYHNINSILFRDIVFTINKKRTRELCELIIDKNIKIHWGCETRIDSCAI